MTSWRCPVCREPLSLGEGSWRCEQGHSFDLAREGYVNLLITHQRRQREPGDTAEMLKARRSFLDTGAYAPLRDAVAAHIGSDDDRDVLDVGCGEGYYTRDLAARVWGIDIAKPAVRMAAQRAHHRYAVASAFDLPLADESVDALVSVFAPLHTPEYDRVLRPNGGIAIIATPGPDHLDGLARVLFDRVEPHPAEPPFTRPGAVSERLRYEITVDEPGALLLMTPWSWYVSPERRAEVAALDALTTTVDFLLTTYRR
jgi:23S rRNA (guanine745-N1)-methyltransferase